jgi:hypothetical protein
MQIMRQVSTTQQCSRGAACGQATSITCGCSAVQCSRQHAPGRSPSLLKSWLRWLPTSEGVPGSASR